jgi:hypothetical protein
VRTKKAAQEITGFTAGKNELFSIPIEEIQFANGNWAQTQDIKKNSNYEKLKLITGLLVLHFF